MRTSKFAVCFSVLCAFLVCTGIGAEANAKQVHGVNFDDAARVAHEDLRLVGAGAAEGVGIYKRASGRVTMGLYMKEGKNTAIDTINVPGAKRLSTVMIQDADAESISRSFLNGVQRNVDRAERGKITNQLIKFGEIFAIIGIFKKGDVINIDWNPSTSVTIVTVNGKQVGDNIPDRAFYNALLLCFIGDRPIDPSLRDEFLGKH